MSTTRSSTPSSPTTEEPTRREAAFGRAAGLIYCPRDSPHPTPTTCSRCLLHDKVLAAVRITPLSLRSTPAIVCTEISASLLALASSHPIITTTITTTSPHQQHGDGGTGVVVLVVGGRLLGDEAKCVHRATRPSCRAHQKRATDGDDATSCETDTSGHG